MSRRKGQWQRRMRQAGGDLTKILPQDAKGRGEWLTKAKDLYTTGEGATVTVPMTPRKEALVRQWLKSLTK